MSRVKLTNGRIRDFNTNKGQSFLWDTDVPGLAVRATAGGIRKPEGNKAYILIELNNCLSMLSLHLLTAENMRSGGST